MSEIDLDTLADELRSWTAGHDANVRAAVELLIEQDHWLWDEAFAGACVRTSGSTTYISWQDADAFLQSGPACSGGEESILRIAIDLGLDRWGISRLDMRNRERVVRAVTAATGATR